MISVIICFIAFCVRLQATQIKLDTNPTCKDLQADCGAETAKCFKKQFRSQMFQHCRKTCRLCVPPGFDNYFRNDESLESINKKPNVLTRPKRQLEAAAKCGNLGPDCLLYTNYCTNQYYLGFMMNHCPLSCGFCNTNFVNNEVGATLSSSSCKDVVNECEELGRIGFCESDEQSTEIKRTLCAATCKLCLRFSVKTSNNSSSLLTIDKSFSNRSSEIVTPQPIIIVGKKVQPATDANSLCIDRYDSVCGKIQEKCNDKEFFDYLIVFCPATCALCGQRKKRNNLIPSVRNRALQFIRRQRVGDEPKKIRGCIDKYEKCDTLISTKSFCENTSGRFLCRATCGYCRPLPTTFAVVSEETNSNKISGADSADEEKVKDVVVSDKETSKPKSDEAKFTEVVIPRGYGKPTIIRIPRKLSDEDNDDDDDVLDKKPKRKIKNKADIDESLGDATVEELLLVEKAKEAKQELEEETLGLPISVRRLLARVRHRNRIPLVNNIFALRRRRLINNLIGQHRLVNGKSQTDTSSRDTQENEKETVELPLTESLEELLTSSELSTNENSEEEKETEKDAQVPPKDPSKVRISAEKPKELKSFVKIGSKDPKQKRRTIILINNGIQTVKNARTKPKKNANKAISKDDTEIGQVSKLTLQNKSKTFQKKENRPVRVILKRKLGEDASVQIVNRASGQPPFRRSHDSSDKIFSKNVFKKFRKQNNAAKQSKPTEPKSKVARNKNSASRIPIFIKENSKKEQKNRAETIEKSKRNQKGRTEGIERTEGIKNSEKEHVNKTEVIKNPHRSESRRKSRKRNSSERKLRQNSQLAPKLIFEKPLEKKHEIVTRVQTEPTVAGPPESNNTPKGVYDLSARAAEHEEPLRLITQSNQSAQISQPEEQVQQITQSSQPSHQPNLSTSILQADQIIPSLNVPQNQANLFEPYEASKDSAKRNKRSNSFDEKNKNSNLEKVEEDKQEVGPNKNWLKKQFENKNPEEKNDSIFRNHLKPADTSDILLSTAISTSHVVEPYSRDKFAKEKKEKIAKRSPRNKIKDLFKFLSSPQKDSTDEKELIDSESAEKNSKGVEVKVICLKKQFQSGNKEDKSTLSKIELKDNWLKKQFENEDKQEQHQQEIVESKENWLKKQFESENKDENNSFFSWEKNQIDGSDSDSSKPDENSLFPVLQKAPWRPPSYHLKEIKGNRN